MKNANISQLQPMSISVKSGDITSAKTVSSTNKIDTPKEGVNKDNPPDSAQNDATEKNVKKTKTIQHLLSDWRTAYAMNKKVILLDLSSYLILSICFFRKQLLGTQPLPIYLNHIHPGINVTRKV